MYIILYIVFVLCRILLVTVTAWYAKIVSVLQLGVNLRELLVGTSSATMHPAQALKGHESRQFSNMKAGSLPNRCIYIYAYYY